MVKKWKFMKGGEKRNKVINREKEKYMDIFIKKDNWKLVKKIFKIRRVIKKEKKGEK
jgi:hypothetical protein